MARESSADILYGFLKTIHESLIEPLKKNQVKLAWQKEIRDSKRFVDAEAKIAEFVEAYDRVKDNFVLRDKVIDALRAIHATRMAQFLVHGKEMTPEECDVLKAALGSYLELLQPVGDIRRMQNTMMGQGKLKKMSLPYEEITATLNEVHALATRMPKILMDGVSDLSDALEKVA